MPLDPRIQAIVDYWSNFLTSEWEVKPPNNQRSGAFAAQIANMTRAERPKPSATQVEAFRQSLAKQITETDRSYLSVGTDYGPDVILSKAMEDAGIERGLSTFPWKTMSFVRPLFSQVGEGHKGPPIVAGVREGAQLFVIDIAPDADILARKALRNSFPEATVAILTSSTVKNSWYGVTTDLAGLQALLRPPALTIDVITLAEARASTLDQFNYAPHDHTPEDLERWSKIERAARLQTLLGEATAEHEKALALTKDGQDEEARRAWHRAGQLFSTANIYRDNKIDETEAIVCWCRCGYWGGAVRLANLLTDAQLAALPGILKDRGVPDLIAVHSPQTYNRQPPQAVVESSEER